jgi:hypothetical protein
MVFAKLGQLQRRRLQPPRLDRRAARCACPTSAVATTWASSLPNVIDDLLHAASVAPEALAGRRSFTLPTSRFSMV